MKATIYWTVQHIRRTAHDLHFQARCWWLSRQVEFVGWRLRLEALMPPVPSKPTAASSVQGRRMSCVVQPVIVRC